MTQTVPEAPMTHGQIEEVLDKLRDVMCDHRFEIPSAVVQQVLNQVLGAEKLGRILFTTFREQVETVSYHIVRRVKVNRNRTQQEALDATNRTQNIDREVVCCMPIGEGDEVEVVFFKPEPWEYSDIDYMSDDDLKMALKRRKLKNDPMAIIAVNEADPTFADENPHGALWEDFQGNLYFIMFRRCRVNVGHSTACWHYDLWFGGVRLPACPTRR